MVNSITEMFIIGFIENMNRVMYITDDHWGKPDTRPNSFMVLLDLSAAVGGTIS